MKKAFLSGLAALLISSSVSAQDLKIAVYGDSREKTNVHNQVVAKIEQDNPQLVFHVGNAVQNGTKKEWIAFREAISPLDGKDIEFHIAFGDHDRNGIFFMEPRGFLEGIWNLPRKQYFYSFNRGSAHFIVLDTNLDLKKEREDLWLDQDLKANSNKEYIFAFMHQPPLNGNGEKDMRRELKDSLKFAEIFEKYSPSAVFCGHQNHYSRKKMGNVQYVITGGAGADLRTGNPLELDYGSVRADHYIIGNISTNAQFKVIGLDNNLIDGFIIQKRNIK